MKMQACECMVLLGGEVKSLIVAKDAVTVAEAACLNARHGEGAVHALVNIREVEVDPVRLKSTLQAMYTRRAGEEKDRDIADKLFPGMSPNFPTTFAAIGVVAPEVIERKAVPVENDFAVFDPTEVTNEDDDDANSEADEDAEGVIYGPDGNPILPASVIAPVVPQGAQEPAPAAVEAPKAEEPAKDSEKPGKPLTAAEKKLAAMVGA